MTIWKDNCRQTRDLLSPYLDGRLSAKQVQKVNDHLRDCRACAEELARLRSTVALLSSLPVVRPPRSFALREATVARPRPVWLPVMRWSTAAAFALLLLLVSADAFSSVALRGAPAAVPQIAQKSSTAGMRAPATEATAGGTQEVAPSAASASSAASTGPSAAATATRDGLKEAPEARDSALGLSVPSATPAPGGDKEQILKAASPQPKEDGAPGGLSPLRLAEGVTALLALLLGASALLAKRVRRL